MLESIWSKVNDALELERGLRTAALQECLRELENCVLPPESTSDYLHLLGYMHYFMYPQQLLEAEELFQQALAIDPSNAYARLYLGHCYYDGGEYKKAEETFLLVNKEDLPDFLRMKVDEMILCCRINLSSLEERLGEVRAFINKYSSENYRDDYPFQLRKLLASNGLTLDDESLRTG